jgi:phosphate:Na+ symporter
MNSIRYIIEFIGGLATFLFAMKIMSDSLNEAAGNRMKQIIKKITDTPLKGVLVGLVVTGIIQSSSATSVMLIGLVNAGIMNLTQVTGVIMGANIGTTITGQLISFKISQYAYLFVSIGVLFIFLKRNKLMEKWGFIIFGFGLLFIAIDSMSNSVVIIKEAELTKQIMASLQYNPLLAVLFGLFLTMIIQSSSASIGILIVLVKTGIIIDMTGAMFIVFGGNIGTTITAWLASISVDRTGKRVALIHSVFNIAGTIIFSILTIKGWFQPLVNFMTTGDFGSSGDPSRYVANTHTLFNILCCLIFMPFTALLVKFANFLIVKDNSELVSSGDPKHLDTRLVKTSVLAVEQTFKEMTEMLILVKLSLETSMNAFLNKNYREQEKISQYENAIDQLQKEITYYLIEINEHSFTQTISNKIPALLHTVNDIEKIGDFAEIINEVLNIQISGQKNYHQEYLEIINQKHEDMMTTLDLLINYFNTFEKDISEKLDHIVRAQKESHFELRQKILLMVQKSECDAVSGINTIDFIDTMEHITEKIENIVSVGKYDFIYPSLTKLK